MVTIGELARWILLALRELGGSAKRADVLREMERLFGSRLQAEDHERRVSGQDVVWRNNASFARKDLVEQGLLCKTDDSGWGIWQMTRAGEREADKLRWRAARPLCPTFRSVAVDVVWRTQMGRSVGLVPRETTFTDNALLQLAISHPERISVQQFTQQQEAETGADWEWWFHDWDGFAGFRTQAKRASPTTGRIALDQPAARTVSTGYQIDVFNDRCRADHIAGLYCIYSDRRPAWQPNLASAGPCPHGPLELAQWGCTVVLAATARRLARQRCFDAEHVLATGMPWYHLVCDHALVGLTAGVHRIFNELRAAEVTAQEQANDLAEPPEVGMSPAIEPPHQVEAYFRGEIRDLDPWAGLTGVVLVDAAEGDIGQG